MIKIFEISKADDETFYAVNRLLPQLSKSANLINLEKLHKLCSSECTRLYFAKEGEFILGMLSIVVFSIPTGTKAGIEDVVVDQKARGKGVGKALMNHALDESKKCGVKSIDLTSRPSRESANKLYQSLGYEVRETNVYRYKFS